MYRLSIQKILALTFACLMCFSATASDSEQRLESQVLEAEQLSDFGNTLELQIQSVVQQRKSLPVIRAGLLHLNHQILADLEQWMFLDKPFLLQERRQRLSNLSQMMLSPSISDAEKYRSLLEALIIEIDYGSRLMLFRESHQIDDKQRIVDILMLGRAVFVARSLDKQLYWSWDVEQGAWTRLEPSHTQQLEQAYTAASDRLSHLKFELPISLSFQQLNTVAFANDASHKVFSHTNAKLTEPLSVAQLELKIESQKLRLSEQQEFRNDEASDLESAFTAFTHTARALIATNNPGLSSVRSPDSTELLSRFVSQENAPSWNDFEILHQIIIQELQLSATISQHRLQHSDVSGLLSHRTLYRIANAGLSDSNYLLSWDPEHAIAFSYSIERAVRSPDIDKLAGGATQFIVIGLDFGPSELELDLTQMFRQKFQQAGLIGKTILAIFCLGVLVGLYRAVHLSIASYQINRQIKHPNQPANNALGRVLSAYQSDKSPNIEALELRLLEIIIEEQHRLDSGLGLIKLFAALAPMLGLLGTVTGMIETFQVITEHGNADPKLMAGGISMALVTTVLGLIAAIGLLFMHSLLNSKAQHLRMIIDKQGLGLVAQRAEMAAHSSAVTGA